MAVLGIHGPKPEVLWRIIVNAMSIRINSRQLPLGANKLKVLCIQSWETFTDASVQTAWTSAPTDKTQFSSIDQGNPSADVAQLNPLQGFRVTLAFASNAQNNINVAGANYVLGVIQNYLNKSIAVSNSYGPPSPKMARLAQAMLDYWAQTNYDSYATCIACQDYANALVSNPLNAELAPTIQEWKANPASILGGFVANWIN
jgi:hypothetical protein